MDPHGQGDKDKVIMLSNAMPGSNFTRYEQDYSSNKIGELS